MPGPEAAIPRCGRYHDEVWGTRTYDESALFEALTLGVFQAGLSWSIVFGKRDAFRSAFHGFDIATVAAMTERDVDRLLQDPSIIRNRAKIQATIENARAMSAGVAEPRRAREVLREHPEARAAGSGGPSHLDTRGAEKFAKQLKSQGYRFVGPTSVYAFMQNVGVVNDHLRGCFRATDYTQPANRLGRTDSEILDHKPAWRRRGRDVLEPALQPSHKGGLRRA